MMRDFVSGWADSNCRPLAPQTSALTGLSHIPNLDVLRKGRGIKSLSGKQFPKRCTHLGWQIYKDSFNSNRKDCNFNKVLRNWTSFSTIPCPILSLSLAPLMVYF